MFETAKEKGQRKPINEAAIETMAAAAVTVLKDRGEFRNVDEAVRKIAGLSGLGSKQLSGFRKNLSSGRRSGNLRPEIVQNYDFAIAQLGRLPTPDVLAVAAHLKTFIR
jgi:hypothetical protein